MDTVPMAVGLVSPIPTPPPTLGPHNDHMLGAVLGRGASSIVFAAGNFAAKYSNLKGLNAWARERVSEEARLWRPLRHVHVVQMIDDVTFGDWHVLILERLHGGELFDRVKSMTYYEELNAARWVRQLLTAVEYLHDERSMIHRDLKPENLLLASTALDAPLKLADFGYARSIGAVSSEGNARTPCGSMGYAAPEQVVVLRGQAACSYGRAADMWSVGVVTYVLLSGTMPFNPSSYLTCLGQVVFREEHFGLVSAEARDFVSQLLSLDPSRRPAAAQALQHSARHRHGQRGSVGQVAGERSVHLRQHGVIPLLLKSAPREVLLVALALGVREVVALVVVEREAQLALVRPQVVLHEVRVLHQVDRLQRELSQPLSPIDLGLDVRRHPATAGLGSPVAVHAAHGGGRRARLLRSGPCPRARRAAPKQATATLRTREKCSGQPSSSFAHMHLNNVL